MFYAKIVFFKQPYHTQFSQARCGWLSCLVAIQMHQGPLGMEKHFSWKVFRKLFTMISAINLRMWTCIKGCNIPIHHGDKPIHRKVSECFQQVVIPPQSIQFSLSPCFPWLISACLSDVSSNPELLSHPRFLQDLHETHHQSTSGSYIANNPKKFPFFKRCNLEHWMALHISACPPPSDWSCYCKLQRRVSQNVLAATTFGMHFATSSVHQLR